LLRLLRAQAAMTFVLGAGGSAISYSLVGAGIGYAINDVKQALMSGSWRTAVGVPQQCPVPIEDPSSLSVIVASSAGTLIALGSAGAAGALVRRRRRQHVRNAMGATSPVGREVSLEQMGSSSSSSSAALGRQPSGGRKKLVSKKVTGDICDPLRQLLAEYNPGADQSSVSSATPAGPPSGKGPPLPAGAAAKGKGKAIPPPPPLAGKAPPGKGAPGKGQVAPGKGKGKGPPPPPADAKGAKAGKGPVLPPSGKGKSKGDAKGGKGPPLPGQAPVLPPGKGKGKTKDGPKGKTAGKSDASQGEEDAGAGKEEVLKFRKKLHWKPLPEVSGTVFQFVKDKVTSIKPKTSEVLKFVFAPPEEHKKEKAFVSKQAGVSLLAGSKPQSLAITFRKSPLSIERLCQILTGLDMSLPLNEEQIDQMIKVWPTTQEIKLVTDYKGDKAELRDVEQYVLKLACVKRGEARLRIIRFAKGLEDLERSYRAHIDGIGRACVELLKSPRWRELLFQALHMGNFINTSGGSGGSSASGFSLDALKGLGTLKGSAGASGLHCLCIACVQHDHMFMDELFAQVSGVHRAAKKLGP